MTEQELICVTKEADDILAALCVKYNISPLSLGAVLLARLVWACRETDAEGDFISLLQVVSASQLEPNYNTHIQH